MGCWVATLRGGRVMCVHKLAKMLSAGTAAALFLFSAVPASATHSWGGYHWARTTTLNIRLADNVGTAWDSYLATASVDWTKSVPIDTTVIQGYRYPYSCGPTSGRVEVCNYRYGYTGWLGVANIWLSYGHIAAGTVRLNDTYFAYSKYNTPAWRRMVMCQEIGHTFGLDHQDENHSNANVGSCMDYTSDPSGTKGTNGTLNNEHPNAHDYDELALIYGHLDGFQLSGTRPASTGLITGPLGGRTASAEEAVAAFDASPLLMKDWGRVAAVDRKGRGRVFVRNLPNRGALVTFVLWVDPEDR